MTTQTDTNITFAEAIFEIRWGSQPKLGVNLPESTPDYKIFLGKVFPELQKTYPFYEVLDAAKAPEDLVQGIAQYRFRKAKEAWPLVQIGPGLFTVNTNIYDWENFKNEILNGITVFTKNYPNIKTLNNPKLILTYIYGVEFDLQKQSMLDYINEKMRLKVQVDPILNKEASLNERDKAMNLKLMFNSSKPEGTLDFTIGAGKKQNSDAIIWNTTLSSDLPTFPQTDKEYEAWVNDAHATIEAWLKNLKK